MKMKKRPSSDPAAPSKNTKALRKQVDGEIFVPVCEPLKYCCLCGQNGKNVRLGCSVPPDYGAKDQDEDEVLLLVCYICYRAVGKYWSPLTVREMLEHSFARGHAPGALDKFFRESYHTSTST